jgi:hypothetical protein
VLIKVKEAAITNLIVLIKADPQDAFDVGSMGVPIFCALYFSIV